MNCTEALFWECLNPQPLCIAQMLAYSFLCAWAGYVPKFILNTTEKNVYSLFFEVLHNNISRKIFRSKMLLRQLISILVVLLILVISI